LLGGPGWARRRLRAGEPSEVGIELALQRAQVLFAVGAMADGLHLEPDGDTAGAFAFHWNIAQPFGYAQVGLLHWFVRGPGCREKHTLRAWESQEVAGPVVGWEEVKVIGVSLRTGCCRALLGRQVGTSASALGSEGGARRFAQAGPGFAVGS
jgi:hypothetical protein